MGWRDAKCLDVLLHQVDAAYPGRSKQNDGTIGDERHQATHSEHNPDANGVVRARDITHDPAHGLDARKLAEALIASRDNRILYVISNAEICSSVVSPWVWRPYNGVNPHREHMHLSVVESPALYDDERPWKIDGAPAVAPAKEGHVGLKKGDHGPAVAELQGLLGITQDGTFGDSTEAAVRAYQAANKLDIDGIVGHLTWGMLLGTPVVAETQSGKGSWYSQFDGRYSWHDGGDQPGSNALGVPDDAQGISFYNHDTLGKWFEVTYPNGHVLLEQQTEIGPAPWTLRAIDIAAVAAERAGYAPKTFPTDALIRWRRVSAPQQVAALSPAQQAIKYRDIRKGLSPMTDPVVPQSTVAPPIGPQPKPATTLPALLPNIDVAQGINYIIAGARDKVRADLKTFLDVFNARNPDVPIGAVTPVAPPTDPTAPIHKTPAFQLGALGVGMSTVIHLLHVTDPEMTIGAGIISACAAFLGPTGGVVASVLANLGRAAWKSIPDQPPQK